MLAAKGPGATLTLADVVNRVITLLHTGLLGTGRSVIMQTQKLESAELSIGGLSMKLSQPVHGYDSVTVDTVTIG